MISKKILDNIRRHEMEGEEKKEAAAPSQRTINANAPCTFIEHQYITVQAGANFYNGPKPEEPQQEVDSEQEVAGELLNIFFGNEEKVRMFLRRIKGAKPTDVTACVNQFIRNGDISKLSCYKPLWEVLNRHELYEKTYNNWLSQVHK